MKLPRSWFDKPIAALFFVTSRIASDLSFVWALRKEKLKIAMMRSRFFFINVYYILDPAQKSREVLLFYPAVEFSSG